MENSICEFLKLSLQVGNVCAILDTGLIFGLHSLVDTCVVFADKNAAALLDHPSFMTLSPVCLQMSEWNEAAALPPLLSEQGSGGSGATRYFV